jgi:branched-chain amino acid transport system permease protein
MTPSLTRTPAFAAKQSSRQALGYTLLIAAGAIAPFVVYPTFLMKVLCFALFACAFNLLLGFAGLLSFGHAAFFGGAAYVCAWLSKAYGVSPELAILAGGLVAALLGAVFGALSIRRSGIYLTMITLALAQLVFFFAVQLPFTGGEDGLQGVPRGKLFGLIDLTNNTVMYFFVFAVFAAGFWLIHRTIHSPFGQVLKAIRENEPRAISLGYDVARYKLLAFVLSAFLAGVAGGMKSLVFQLASLTDAHWHMSGEVVLMTLLGGLGTLFGPAVGAFTIVALENELADKVGPWVTVIMGAIFVICVLIFRRGLVGELLARLGPLGANKPPQQGH